MMSLIDYGVEVTQEKPPDRIRWPQYGPILRGWLACEFDQPISSNPHEAGSPDWKTWREGWFARNSGESAVEPCETWDDVPQG